MSTWNANLDVLFSLIGASILHWIRILQNLWLLWNECDPPPTNPFMRWNFNPHRDSIRGEAFGRWLGHKGEVLMNGINDLKRRDKRACPPSLICWLCKDTVRRQPFVKSGPMPSPYTASAQCFHLGLSKHSELWKVNACCLRYPICGNLL